MKAGKLVFLLFGSLSVLFVACDKSEVVEKVTTPAEVKLVLDTRVGDDDFSLNKDFKVGELTYQFNKLRYWVSNVVLVQENGTEYEVPESYFLMEEVPALDLTGTISDNEMIYPATKRDEISLTDIPAGSYQAIRFSVGVDAKRNDNLSLRAGELSIANGMSNISWMWHTSYIFSSIGGEISNGSGEPTAFLAETGLNENYKTITAELPSPLSVNDGASRKVTLSLDIASVLQGVDLLATPTVGARQPEAMRKIADNFSERAFSYKASE